MILLGLRRTRAESVSVPVQNPGVLPSLEGRLASVDENTQLEGAFLMRSYGGHKLSVALLKVLPSLDLAVGSRFVAEISTNSTTRTYACTLDRYEIVGRADGSFGAILTLDAPDMAQATPQPLEAQRAG